MYSIYNSSIREPRDILDRHYYSLFSRGAIRRDLYNTTTEPIRSNIKGLLSKKETVQSKTVSMYIELADRHRTHKD
jgi:hypothetical protein